MALNIVSNFAASVAQRQLAQANDAATESVAKLSAGKRIISAKDDAAASAIAARLSAEVAGLRQASVNAGQASSLLQIADGAFSNTQDILTRLKSLAVQAGSDQLSNTERSFLDQEFQNLLSEVDRIANDTEFNGNKLVNGATQGLVADGTKNFNNITTTSGGTGPIQAAGTLANVTGVTGVVNRGVDLNQGTIMTAGGNNTVSGQDFNISITLAGAMLNAGTATASATFKIANVAVTTTGGGTANATFTGMVSTLAAANVNFSSAGSTVAITLSKATDLVLMATGTSVQGSLVVGLGTGFSLMTGGGATSTFSTSQTMVGFLVGQASQNFNFKVGTGTDSTEDEISISIGGITTKALGINNTNVSTKAAADSASVAVSKAIDTLQSRRSDVGAAQNRLDFAGQNVDLTVENQEAARSELEDLNVAVEITNFTSKQLLVQAGTSVLAQANQLPQNLLALFQ